jgi:hypothetical protein
VVGVPVPRHAAAAATRLHAKIARSAVFQVIGDANRSRPQGIGLRGGYSSPGKLGEYAVFVADTRRSR